MRLMKQFGLAAVLALALMAACGAAPAGANTSTQLCTTHTGLTCSKAASSVAMTLEAGTVGKLLNSLATVLCLGAVATATPLALGKPQEVHVMSLAFTNCGTNTKHDNCKVEVLELPLGLLLKTGLDEGTITFDSGQTLVFCENVFFGVDMHCVYDMAGTSFSVGGQHLTTNKVAVTELNDLSLCPDESKLDGLLETVSAYTALCISHTKPCPEIERAESVDMRATQPPVFYNPVANVECESSLAAATVLGAAEPLKLDVTELSWKGCHTQGAADNCTVSTKGLPTLSLNGTTLNLGKATTSGLEVAVECLILDLIELDCVYGGDVTLEVEGALHTEGAGNGKFTAAKAELEKLEGEGHCPESVKWDASYEFAEHLYVVPWTEKGGSTYILQ